MPVEVPQEFQDRLVKFLCSIKALEIYDNRTRLLRKLPESIVGNLPRSQAYASDLRVIVEWAASYGKLLVVMSNSQTFVEGAEKGPALQDFRRQFARLMEPVGEKEFRFVNREEEIYQLLSDYMQTFLLLSAPPGYGKTWLLRELKKRFEGIGKFCVLIDVEKKEPGSARDIIAQIGRQFDTDLLPDDFPVDEPDVAERLRPVARDFANYVNSRFESKLVNGAYRGVVILLDLGGPNCSMFESILTHFIPAFLDVLSKGVVFRQRPGSCRVIAAGRYWEHMDISITFTLSPFTHRVIQHSIADFRATLIQGAFIPSLAAHVIHYTGGHPGCLAKILEEGYWGESPDQFLAHLRQGELNDIILPAVKEVRNKIPESLRHIADTISLLRRLDNKVLQMLIAEEVVEWKKSVAKLADSLTGAYLRERVGSLLKDHIYRRLLAIRLREETPARFAEVCEKARKIYKTRLQQDDLYPHWWAIECLFQFLQAEASSIISIDGRQTLYDKFFSNTLVEVLESLVRGRDADVMKLELLEALQKDFFKEGGEFRFTVNYFLRGQDYSDEPYERLIQEIESFFQEGNDA